MLQPEASDFVGQWARFAPSIISYAELKTDNSTVRALLAELNNGGHGQCADDGCKPPQCLYTVFQ